MNNSYGVEATIIDSNSSLFDLQLKKVWSYRDLLYLLVKRDIITFYKQTVFGPIWFFIQPIFTTITFVFVFGNLAGITTGNIPPPLFYLLGVTAWGFFSECFLKTSTVFIDNANIFSKVYFPRLIMPISIVLSNLVRFGIQLALLFVVMLYYFLIGTKFTFGVFTLYMPLLITLMAILGLGLGMIISAMTTKYRDLSFLIKFGIQLFMYLTTVIYPLSSVSGQKRIFIEYNPMTQIIEGLRLGLLGQGTFSHLSLFYTITITAIILFIGVVTFNKAQKSFIDTI
jgi:lipopolysaccharide transport system permease protein